MCCYNVYDNGLPMAKAIVMLGQPGIACALQGITALHWAAVRGHAAVVETLMLNSTDREAENKNVSCGSCFCIFGIDKAHSACERSALIIAPSCNKCRIHDACGQMQFSAYYCRNRTGNDVLLVAKAVVLLLQPAVGRHCTASGFRSGSFSCCCHPSAQRC